MHDQLVYYIYKVGMVKELVPKIWAWKLTLAEVIYSTLQMVYLTR